MTYTRVTADDFAKKVRSGHYRKAVDANRAIGKSALSDGDKRKCAKVIAEHFGAEASPPVLPATTKKKASVKRRPAKKAKRPAAKKKKASKKAAKKKTTKKAAKHAGKGNSKPSTKSMFQVNRSDLSDIKLADQQIGTLTQAVHAMKLAKEADTDVKLGSGPQSAADALSAVVKRVHSRVLEAGMEEDPPAAPIEGNEDSGAPVRFAATAPKDDPAG